MKHNRIHYYRIFLAIVLAIVLGVGIWYCWHSYRLHMVPKDGVLVEEDVHMTPKDGVFVEEDMYMGTKDGVFVKEDVTNDFRGEKTGWV